MTSSANAKDVVTFNTGNNPIAFQLTKQESLKPIPQPTSTDEAVVKIWQRQMLIPFFESKLYHRIYKSNSKLYLMTTNYI